MLPKAERGIKGATAPGYNGENIKRFSYVAICVIAEKITATDL